MTCHLGHGAVNITAVNRIEKPPVLSVVSGDAMRGQHFVLPSTPLRVSAHIIDVPVEPQHDWILRALGQCEMKGFVGGGESIRIRACRLDGLQGFAQPLQIPGVGVYHCQFHHMRLQREPDFDELEWTGGVGDIFVVEFLAVLNKSAAANAARNQTDFLESSERFTHGTARGAEVVR